MTTYCENQDVINRLSSVGALYCVDDDNDGTLNATETALITDAVESVSAVIDGYLTPVIETVPISQTSGSLNRWLRDRCVDLACERLCSRKGKAVVKSIKEMADWARGELDKVQAKEMRVPGLVYPGDGFVSERRQIGRPVVANPYGHGRR